jgi:glutamate-1-semialdehyde 2,1-aminomutase
MPKADSPPFTPVADQILNLKHQDKIADELENAVMAAKQRFIDRNPNSKKLFEEACGSLPGGNTRTQLYTAPFPVFMKKGEGYKVFDEDNHV